MKHIFSITKKTIIASLVFALGLTGFIITNSYSTKIQDIWVSTCPTFKNSIGAFGISTGKFSCNSQPKTADFEIAPPYKNAGIKRFWQNRSENQWLMWGNTSEPENDFTINVAWKKSPDQYSGNLRNSLRVMKRFKRGKVIVSSKYTRLNVHKGDFEVLPFIYRDQSLLKKCLGFTNKKNNKKLLVKGWLCKNKDSSPTAEQVECALSTLNIYGILSPDKSRNWCSIKEMLRST